MKIAYVVPGPMDRTEMGVEEMHRRERKLRSWAFPGTEVDVVAVDRGPASIESAFEEYLSIQPTAELIQRLEGDGYDAAIVGCFGDPGLDGFREISDMLVVGPAASSMALAVTLGNRFGIVTVTESIVHALRRLAWDVGVLEALSSVRFVDIPVLGLNKDPEESFERMVEEGHKAMRDGADTLVLGCMTMGFLDVAERMTERLSIPVVNPAKAALKVTESSLAMGLKHSRRAYLKPPKVELGKQVEDLFVRPEATLT